MPEPSPRTARNNAPFLLRDSAPPVLVSLWSTVALPVAGSSCIPLLASLLANRNEPLRPAIGPSTLLPSHAHTTFHFWPSAITPGMAVDLSGRAGAGGAPAAGEVPAGIEKGFAGLLHFAVTAARPGLCQACRLCPRPNVDAGGLDGPVDSPVAQ